MKETWFLWAINDDPRTNECLAELIGGQYPDTEQRDVLCADNARRNLWECRRGYDEVRRAITARVPYALHVEVFLKTGNGPVVQWNLWKPQFRRRARQTRLLRSKVKRAS
jgi:hypothetical protein